MKTSPAIRLPAGLCAALVLLGALALHYRQFTAAAIVNGAMRQWLAGALLTDFGVRPQYNLSLPAQLAQCESLPEPCRRAAGSLRRAQAWNEANPAAKIHLAELSLVSASDAAVDIAGYDMPDWRIAWLAAGLYEKGDILQAQVLFSRLIDLQPNSALLFARAYRRREDAAMTVWLMNAGIQTGQLTASEEAQAEEQIGEVYRKLEFDAPKAILHLKRAIELRGPGPEHNTQNALAYYHLGAVYLADRQYPEAAANMAVSFQLAEAAGDNSDRELLVLGTALRLSGQTELALETLCTARNRPGIRDSAESEILKIVGGDSPAVAAQMACPNP